MSIFRATFLVCLLLTTKSCIVCCEIPPSFHKLRTLLVDCDGVLWSGPSPKCGSIEALNYLQMHRPDIKVYFLTNNSAKTRQQYSDKFFALGHNVDSKQIVTSSSITAYAVAKKGISRVLMLGNSALRAELESVGIEVDEIPDSSLMEEAEFDSYIIEPKIDALVLGWDKSFTYRKLAISSLLLQKQKCPFFVTNTDACDRTPSGNFIPVTGPLAAAIEIASGCKPILCGKPSDVAIDYIRQLIECSATDEVCMIGDRLDTDIEFANKASFHSCCVLTGCTTREEAMKAHDNIESIVFKGQSTDMEDNVKTFFRRPTKVAESFGDFVRQHL